jgi:hypothetical protein
MRTEAEDPPAAGVPPARGAALATELGAGALALFLALVQFRLIAFVLDRDLERSVNAALGVVSGRPHWRIYQSRVLGPYLVDALTAVLPSYSAAHAFFAVAALTVAGYLAWRLGRRIGASTLAALLGLVVFHLAFAGLLSRPWLYAWDFLDAIVFLVFLDCVVARRSWPWFAALYAVAILNRETAHYIALWMILDPFLRWRLATPRAPRPGLAMSAAGLACIAGGLALVETLRRRLLVEEIGPYIFRDATGEPGQLFANQLGANLELLGRLATRFDDSLPLLAPAFLVLVAAAAIALARRDPPRFAGVSLVHLALVGSFFAFAALLETRAYVVLVPFTVLAAVTLATPRGGR